MSKTRIYYGVRVTRGDGHRVLRAPRFEKKTQARLYVKKLQRSWRTDADTRNPRIIKFRGYR